MCDSNLRNDNIFLISARIFGEAPKVYSSFQKAEEELLSQVRAMKYSGFTHVITCVQVDSNLISETHYSGDIKIKDGFKHITIQRDKDNWRGCKKTHREKIRISLDY